MLTDAERVEQALADAGGQLRQQELLERSGWTKARMSRLLSYMADAGTVVKFRVGRENVVCLEDAVPAILRDTDDDQDGAATTEETADESTREGAGDEAEDADGSP